MPKAPYSLPKWSALKKKKKKWNIAFGKDGALQFLSDTSFWKQIKKHSIIVGKLMNDLKNVKIEPYLKQKEEKYWK